MNDLVPLVEQWRRHNEQQPLFALVPKLGDDQQSFIGLAQGTFITQNNAFQIRRTQGEPRGSYLVGVDFDIRRRKNSRQPVLTKGVA